MQGNDKEHQLPEPATLSAITREEAHQHPNKYGARKSHEEQTVASKQNKLRWFRISIIHRLANTKDKHLRSLFTTHDAKITEKIGLVNLRDVEGVDENCREDGCTGSRERPL